METWTNEMRTHTWNNKKYFWAHRTLSEFRDSWFLKRFFLLTLVCVAYLHLSWCFMVYVYMEMKHNLQWQEHGS